MLTTYKLLSDSQFFSRAVQMHDSQVPVMSTMCAACISRTISLSPQCYHRANQSSSTIQSDKSFACKTKALCSCNIKRQKDPAIADDGLPSCNKIATYMVQLTSSIHDKIAIGNLKSILTGKECGWQQVMYQIISTDVTWSFRHRS